MTVGYAYLSPVLIKLDIYEGANKVRWRREKKGQKVKVKVGGGRRSSDRGRDRIARVNGKMKKKNYLCRFERREGRGVGKKREGENPTPCPPFT